MVRITGRGVARAAARGARRASGPTTELARKAAFDILGDAIRGARVLDACAGSGAYGLEALSRGAAHATFVESDRKVAESLEGECGAARCGGHVAASRRCPWPVFLRRVKKGGAGPRPVAPRSTWSSTIPLSKKSPPNPIFISCFLSCVPGGWLFHERGDDLVLAPGRRSARPTGAATASRGS